jgi:hypothetical protein
MAFLALGSFSAVVPSADCGALPGTDAAKAFLNPPGSFTSLDELKSFFEQHGVVAQIKVVQGKSRTFCFVWDDPFSGVDTTILYCYC